MNAFPAPGAAARLAVLPVVLAVVLAVVLSWTPAAEAQPNTPEYAARMAYEAAHSFDVDTLLEYACIEGREQAEIRQFFADQVHGLEQNYGLDWNQVTIDFSQVRYQVLEQVGDQARVRITGPYVILYQGEREVDEDPDVIIVQKVDGRWLMCGDQDMAQYPLAGEPVGNAPQSAPPPSGGFLVGKPSPAGETRPDTPEYAARMAYETAHRLDAEGFARWACVEASVLEQLKADFVDLQQAAARSVGVPWSQVDMDFSRLTYELLEQVEDQARVRVRGDYVITYPGGREVDEDPDVILMRKVDGRWLMCGDQDMASMPLSPYSSPNY